MKRTGVTSSDIVHYFHPPATKQKKIKNPKGMVLSAVQPLEINRHMKACCSLILIYDRDSHFQQPLIHCHCRYWTLTLACSACTRTRLSMDARMPYHSTYQITTTFEQFMRFVASCGFMDSCHAADGTTVLRPIVHFANAVGK